MDLKLYLNKFAKLNNIENYTLNTVIQMKEVYSKFLEEGEGKDPDFPLITFDGKKGKTISIGVNSYKTRHDDQESDTTSFDGFNDLF